jgi:hypothetical protein
MSASSIGCRMPGSGLQYLDWSDVRIADGAPPIGSLYILISENFGSYPKKILHFVAFLAAF